ncbi:MAG: HlyD family secretion protein [Desulfomicrobiaceae bacterium]|jgi:membrane fusion protein (multidrug efflux system)|nr:HlyD family secretion protein [Desulfomicrobiaceae bacterium]MBZ4647844.1 secretion protein HlyD family protein [Desulfomicrobiaceae bacterium]
MNGLTWKGNAKAHRIVAVLFVLLAAGAGYLWWSHGRESTDDAFVEGHIHPVAARVSGTVVQVLVDENQVVEEGQPLVLLDPTDYEVAVAQARADLATAEAVLASASVGVPLQANQTDLQVAAATAAVEAARRARTEAEAQVAAAENQIRGLEAALQLAQLDLQRQTRLRAQDLVPQAALDAARTHHDQAKAALDAARARLAAAMAARDRFASEVERAQAAAKLASTGQDVTTIKDLERRAAAAKRDLARERLRQAELQLSYTRILAPARGQVSKKSVEAGMVVAAGKPLLAIVPLDPERLWVTANFKESQIGRMRPGQRVEITVDALPGVRLTGQVDSIMAGTGAVFSLFPPENAMGNYVKVVQRVPVRIRLDPYDPAQVPLRLGLSVVPTVFVE